MAAVLKQALHDGSVVENLAALLPPQPGYARLRAALARWRELAAHGEWAEVPPGPLLRPGDRDPRVEPLRARLVATGDIATVDIGEAGLFDPELEAAVERFQQRHGLDSDGVVGAQTLAALNQSPQERVGTLRVNLERWRWLPQSLGRRHVLVNIAGFDLYLAEDGQRVLEMRAIVGRTFRRTPVFSDQISYLVLNPSWTVPPKIAVEDKLPLIAKDPSYLGRQGIQVLSGWGAEAVEVEPRLQLRVHPHRAPLRARRRPSRTGSAVER